jgi:integrase
MYEQLPTGYGQKKLARKLPTGLARSDVRYWRTRVFRPSYSRHGEQRASPNLCVQLQHRGQQHKWSLQTPNRDVAAVRARDLWLLLQAKGWDAAIAKYRPELAAKKRSVITVGEFLEVVRAESGLEPKTFAGYAKALRKIVSDSFKISEGSGKFDHRAGGRTRWLTRVHAIHLADLNPARVNEWKRLFLTKARRDPLSQRQAKTSINSYMRQAKSLFSPQLLRHLSIELPNPFAGVAFEPRQSTKYRSGFDVTALIKQARADLAEAESELYKIFLLAVMVGLRRREIDLLEWSSFQWEAGTIRIEPTEFFHPKTEESIADVPVDPELLALFGSYQIQATGPFVVESAGTPKPNALYPHYRCAKQFEQLTGWLRNHGVRALKPLHTLRKEFGSQVNLAGGIYAASRSLRHSSITMTAGYYTDSRAQVTSGLGHLLKD